MKWIIFYHYLYDGTWIYMYKILDTKEMADEVKKVWSTTHATISKNYTGPFALQMDEVEKVEQEETRSIQV